MPSGVFSLKQQVAAIRQGAWTNRPPTAVNYLVVAGGGGSSQGGGGGGGLIQGNLPFIPGTSYSVTVGGGGAAYTQGSNSVFGSVTAIGGGTGGGGSGGSGGGGNSTAVAGSIGGQGTSGQGNGGGNGSTTSAIGGGGGGAGTVGLAGSGSIGGNGGAGIASDISGTRALYAGGGAGASTPAASGGVGGGGNTDADGGGNTGGGAGGGYAGAPKAGGSGIVIVSYPGTTQWFTGGTLSYANGNVIHTFYSSGTLAPTAPSNFVNTDYQITRSLRFNSADSAYLSRSPASATNRKTWTWSGWIKKSDVLNASFLFSKYTDASNRAYFDIREYSASPAGYVFLFFNRTGGVTTVQLESTQVFRDPSAWYHIVVAVDTTQTTASNRVRLYVNGSQVTAFGTATYPAQNADLEWNATGTHEIGGYSGGGAADCYMTEINFVDGQSLPASAFGYINPNTGVWSPLKFVGTYGTNGFYLNFSDNSNTTAATLGKDYSGNGNNWTPNNFSVTAGAGNDSLVDTPTNYGSDTGAGGTVRGNYCTFNPLSTSRTITNGNLYTEVNGGGGSNVPISATMAIPTSGKYYWEITAGGAAGGGNGGWDWGIVNITVPNFRLNNLIVVGTGGCYGVNGNDGNFRENNTTGIANYISGGISNGDVAMVAYDADNGKLWLGKNGTWGNDGTGNGDPAAGLRPAKTAAGGMTGQFIPVFEYASDSGLVSATANFGQRPFAYTAPSGFKALCTQNLSTPTVAQGDDYFNTVLYTGTGATQSITGVGFETDFVWIKCRSVGYSHNLLDRLRGITNARLFSNLTDAENTGTTYINSTNSDGFQLAVGDNGSNGTGATYVAWNWKANGAGVTNTAGSITSTVSANTTSGFSIITWTGNATQGATIGHGLGAVPALLIFKNRSVSATEWPVKSNQLSTNSYLYLNATNASASYSFFWSAEPTSSLIYLGSDNRTNGSGNSMVCYAFAEVAGYSKFGSYTGNGSTDGPFVYLGFRPKFIMFKRTDSVNVWSILDTSRDPYNVANLSLQPSNSIAEETGKNVDFLSNGFKQRQTDPGWNASGGTYIYAAFAENPFKYALAR